MHPHHFLHSELVAACCIPVHTDKGLFVPEVYVYKTLDFPSCSESSCHSITYQSIHHNQQQFDTRSAAVQLLAIDLSNNTLTSATVSPFKTTTYYYNPKTEQLLSHPSFDRLTVSSTPVTTQRPSTPELGYYSSPATTPLTSPIPKTAKMARTVSFGAPEGARDARNDESEVMRTFHRHVKHCDTCYNNLNSWTSGKPLCYKGHNYVVDMRPYFFCKAGKPYSLIDRERFGEMTRVLVSSEYKYMSMLFEALNAGYSTNPSRQIIRPKVVIHQPTTVASQPEPRRYERPTITIPTQRYQSTRLSPRSGERYQEHREPRYRGSLYHEDERRRNRYGEEVVYSASPRSPRYHL